jgi:hypothetical protein
LRGDLEMGRKLFCSVFVFVLFCVVAVYLQGISDEIPNAAFYGYVHYYYPAEFTQGRDHVSLYDSTKTHFLRWGEVREWPGSPTGYDYGIVFPVEAGHYWLVGHCDTWDYPVEYYVYHDGVHVTYQDVYFGSHATPDGGDE